MSHRNYQLTVIAVLTLLSITVHAQQQLGIRGHKAPKWDVSEWHNLPTGVFNLDINDFKGKVIYIYCFQSWCPGCHKYGFPTLQKVIKRYKHDPQVAIVAIQTTFEGFSTNTFSRAEKVAKRYQLSIPIGQSGTDKHRSAFMARYRTGGTPWTIIVDRNGIVRYNHFHIDPQQALRAIDYLKNEK